MESSSALSSSVEALFEIPVGEQAGTWLHREFETENIVSQTV